MLAPIQIYFLQQAKQRQQAGQRPDVVDVCIAASQVCDTDTLQYVLETADLCSMLSAEEQAALTLDLKEIREHLGQSETIH